MISNAEAEFILNIIGTERAWIFFNNFTDDISAYNSFAKKDNIILIGTADEYHYETVKHLIDREIKYRFFDCSEISKDEARLIYNKIPTGLKKSAFKYKDSEDEKFSMLELVAQNVVGVYAKKHISKMLNSIARENDNMFTVIIIATYLSEYGSALSYANVSAVLDIDVYPDAVELVKKVKEYLRTYDFHLDGDEIYQDYFVLRSKLFAYNAMRILLDEHKSKFADVVKRFTLRESRYNIARYNVFRRKAYDAQLFSELFTQDEAISLYNTLYDIDGSPYTLQQKALCQTIFHNYNEAFICIDKAISEMPNNFSFKNSQAIIMFEANKTLGSEEAIEHMRAAMETLRICYNNDKRKIYHAQKFSEFAIYFHKYFNCSEYLEDALHWLDEMSNQDGNVSSYTKRLKEKLSSLISTL